MKRTLFLCFLVVSLSLSLYPDIAPKESVALAQSQQSIGARKASADLIEKVKLGRGSDLVRVIIEPTGGWDNSLDASVRNSGGSNFRQFQNFHLRVVTLPANAALALSLRKDIFHVSLDREVRTLGHLSRTTGADAVRVANETTTTGLDGTGVGIAVLDSGIYTGHKSFLDKNNHLRVVVSQDFTGEARTDDPYGHGTHVASIAAGNGRIATAKYIGIAPNASIINLRVLNSGGVGSTSGVLSALDWVATNRTLYNIRVVNMSLGMPAVDSYRNDPVCRAVRGLVNAGMVVVAAAGNNGVDSNGHKVYGHIHSPGNEPSALTVGASNTFGTDARKDDGVASYSSRGPTRSYWTDAAGLKHYDNLVKPDLVAPGNKLIDAEAVDNFLVTQNPQLDAAVSNLDECKMMYLSGTSMATPVAAGAAALMLETNPTLTPNMVKALLMYAAQPLPGFNMFEQGAGQINIEGAVRLATLLRTDLSAGTPLGDPLLRTSELPVAQTTIADYTFNWSRGIVCNYTYATGPNLITKYQRIYGLGSLLGDGVISGDGVITGDTTMISDGVITGDQIMTINGVIIVGGTPFIEDR